MRALLIAGLSVALLGAFAPEATSAPAAKGACLSSGDVADAVLSHKVVAPTEAIGKARGAVPAADILRASLCRDTDALVYQITALRRDGRLVRVTVDGRSGKVRRVH